MIKAKIKSQEVVFDEPALSLFRQLQEAAEEEHQLEKFLEKTAAIIGKAFGHTRVTIFLYDEATQELFFVRGWKTEPVDFPAGYRQKIDQGLMGKAVRERQPVVVNDVSQDKDYLAVPGVKVGSEACFPIRLKNEVLGLLDVHDSRKRAFSKREVDFLNFLTRFLGSALVEKRKTEELLIEQQKLREILDGMRDGYYEVDLKGNFVFVNESLAKSWGRNRKNMIGRNYRDFLEPISIEKVFPVFNEVYRTGQPKGGVEIQVTDVNGKVHNVEFSISLKKNTSGEPSGFYGIIHDVTERVKAEDELRQAYARISELMEAFPDAIYFKDLSGRYLIVNQAMEKLTGRRKEEIIGKKDEEIFPEELARQCRQSDEQVIQTGRAGVFFETLPLENGQLCYFESHKALFIDDQGQVYGIVGLSRDVTDKKLAEDKLNQSERDFRSLFENSTLGLYRTTPDGRILLANPTLVRMLGYESFEELASRNLEKEGEPGYERKKFIEQIEKNGEIRGLEAAWKRKDGSLVYVRESARAMRDESGRVLYYEGTVEDITEKKLAEMALAEQRKLFQTVVDSADDIVFVLDKNYELILFNQAAAKTFGLEREQIEKRNFKELYPQENWSEAAKRFERVFSGEVVREDVELRFGDKKIILNVTEVPLRNEKGEIYALCGIGRDLTTRVELEKALEISLREKEVLLREIHHRVKNNMQVISSLLNLQAHFVNRPEFTSIIKECQNRIRSIALVHEHLYRSTNLASINFADYLNKLVIHLYNVHKISEDKINLEINLDDIFLEIGMAIPLGLLSTEIISNCFKHAFPGERKGRVVISLKKIAPENYQLKISDDGIGLPDNINIRESKSFGLQLINLLGEQIGARIEVERKGGTTFSISFESHRQEQLQFPGAH
ncbi:MAG TPA: PAS domain S-box protein [Candidatus Aminicenantes bacterium]|nr:PAS domain S-box protein [Candidatus Aminicenantes bacterium]